VAEIVQINACDITCEFEMEISKKIKEFWIGTSYPGTDKPQCSYEESYLEILGEVPILITAPHAVPHDRGEDKLKEQDDNTYLLVMEICKNTNGNGLIALKPLADPNKLSTSLRKINPPVWKGTKEVSFFLEAERVVKSRNIEFLLDIHGMADSYEDSAVVGTNGAKGKDLWADKLKAHLRQNGVKTSIDFTRTLVGKRHDFSGGDFVRNIFIPGLQVEIERTHRKCNDIQASTGWPKSYLAFYKSCFRKEMDLYKLEVFKQEQSRTNTDSSKWDTNLSQI